MLSSFLVDVEAVRGADVDVQLLDAAKTGDLDLVKVSG